MEIIDITNKLRDFEEHLKLNRQTIVSAKFGDGKTYFLNKHIEQHEQDTFFIVLHPVNYVVSSNEDIFEYIKRDILCALMQTEELQNIDWKKTIKDVLLGNDIAELTDDILTVLAPHLQMINKVIPIAKILPKSVDVVMQVRDKVSLNKYIEHFHEVKGSLFELDDISIVIKKTIQAIQTHDKRCVLVIEDLDRIDPEHLFRILNVLGAHVDEDKNTNKFGFDNIIAVLDYETTEHIFHHFYGAQANYKGYMSKFMSSYPFRYSITEVARDQLLEYFKNECHIELLDEFPKDINGKSLLETANNLSVREIVQILDNINNQIDLTDVELPYGYKTYSNDYITRFLAVLVRMGYKVSNNALVEYYTDEFEHFRILNNYLLAVGIYNNPLFEFNGSWCGYSVRHDGDYKFISRTGGVGGDIVNTPIVDVVVKALDTAIDKVKDGKQMLVYNELEG